MPIRLRPSDDIHQVWGTDISKNGGTSGSLVLELFPDKDGTLTAHTYPERGPEKRMSRGNPEAIVIEGVSRTRIAVLLALLPGNVGRGTPRRAALEALEQDPEIRWAA